MAKPMGIYTKKGDLGRTALFGGKAVDKSDLQVQAYGEVDEAICRLGHFIAVLKKSLKNSMVIEDLRSIQRTLFRLGFILAGYTKEPWDSKATDELEKAIDQWERELPPLKSFVLPGGCEETAICHLVRTQVRCAERWIVRWFRFYEENQGKPYMYQEEVLQYINRLSDYFFMLARWLHKELLCKEELL